MNPHIDALILLLILLTPDEGLQSNKRVTPFETGLTVIVAIAVCVPLLSSIFMSLNKIPRTGGTRASSFREGADFWIIQIEQFSIIDKFRV
ncbi:Usherin [Dirofilaria immitis]